LCFTLKVLDVSSIFDLFTVSFVLKVRREGGEEKRTRGHRAPPEHNRV